MLSAWLSLWARAGLILGAAALLTRISARKLSPEARHRLLTFGFGLLLVWPLLSIALPELPLPFGSAGGRYLVTVSQTTRWFGTAKPPSTHWNWILIIWLLGVIVSLIPVAIGTLRVHRLVRRAAPLDTAQSHATSNLLVHDGPLTPMTFGILRPRILLPAASKQWNEERFRMVVLHEFAHIHRRDLLWQNFARVVSALWWFQPLCWMNLRRLRQESEKACDRCVVESGIRASDYADALLRIARDLRTSGTLQAAAIPMTQPTGLENRIRAILNDDMARATRFPAVATAALACLAFSVSAVTVFPQQDFEGDHPMKKTLITGLLASAGLIATSGGAVLPPHGGQNSTTQSKRKDDKPLRVGGEVAQANLISKVNPVYPVSAKKAGIQGQVLLDVTISKEGVPEDIQVVTSPSDDLTQSAEDAVRQWRYRPTLLNGEPIEIITEVKVNYTLSK